MNRKKITKRPMVLVFLGYSCFLLLVVAVFPSAGERIFGWTKKETLLKAWTESFEERQYSAPVITLAGKVENVQETAYGYRWTIKVDRKTMEHYTQMEIPLQGFRVTVYSDEKTDVGSIVWMKGRVTFPEDATNPGQWDEHRYYREQNILCKIRPSEWKLLQEADHSVFSLFACTRDAVLKHIDHTFQQPYAGIIAAMLTGDKGLLDQEEKELLQKGGISHVIAISGMHLSILAEWICAALGLVMPKRKAQPLTACLLWIYAFWTGGATATLRAALMFTVKTMAPALGREYDFMSCYSFSALVLLLIDPLRILSGSFYLSFGALLGLEVGRGIVMNLPLIPYILRRWLAGSLGVSMITMPLSLWFFYESSFSGVLLNLWVLPTVPLVLLLGIIALVFELQSVSLLLPGAGTAFIKLTEGLLRSYETLSRILGNTRWLMSTGRPHILWMLAYFSLIALIFGWLSGKGSHKGKIRASWAVGILMSLILILIPYRENKVTFLDVGQGDCTVIEWQGKCILIDAGPSYEKVIKPYLKYRGIDRIDLMILSHPDQDHMAGALLLSEDPDIQVQMLALSACPMQKTEERDKLIRNLSKSSDIVFLQQDDEIRLGKDCVFKVLLALEQVEDMNDSSLVILAEISKVKILFPGDISVAAEEELVDIWKDRLQLWNEIQVDVLKTAHHGSGTSTSRELLDLIRPEIAVISCGRNNRYGHPAKETLDRLEKADVKILTTPEKGCIQLWIGFAPWRRNALSGSMWAHYLCYKE